MLPSSRPERRESITSARQESAEAESYIANNLITERAGTCCWPRQAVSAMPLGVEVALRGVFNRARRGLYAGKQIRSGNNISEDGKNK